MAEITITEAEQRRSTAQILDVREDFEIAEGMIPDALNGAGYTADTMGGGMIVWTRAGLPTT